MLNLQRPVSPHLRSCVFFLSFFSCSSKMANVSAVAGVVLQVLAALLPPRWIAVFVIQGCYTFSHALE
jgi:hypothetical protein